MIAIINKDRAAKEIRAVVKINFKPNISLEEKKVFLLMYLTKIRTLWGAALV